MFVIVMGVSGSGKTTVGTALAESLHYPFYDGDDFHPPENVAKMASGIPLTDADRAGWLNAIANLIHGGLEAGQNGVIACSALRETYRQVLRRANSDQVKFLYLRGTYEQILSRMQQRGEHFMKPEMLRSQFDTLEVPSDVLTIDITHPVGEIVQFAITHLMKP